jgi:hypothetical protein
MKERSGRPSTSVNGKFFRRKCAAMGVHGLHPFLVYGKIFKNLSGSQKILERQKNWLARTAEMPNLN